MRVRKHLEETSHLLRQKHGRTIRVAEIGTRCRLVAEERTENHSAADVGCALDAAAGGESERKKYRRGSGTMEAERPCHSVRVM
jgi:hypothetical protein